MNKPIRTIVDLLPAAVRGAAAQRDLPAVLPRRRAQRRRRDNRRVRDAAFSRERGAILVGRHAGRGEHRSPTTSTSSSAIYPQPLQVRPAHRLLLLRLRPDRRRAHPERRPLRQRPRGCSSTGSSTWSATTPAQGRQRRADHRPRGAEGGVRRAARARPATSQGAVVALEPSHRQDPRDGRRCRPTTPTSWPATTSARCRRPTQRSSTPTRAEPLLNRAIQDDAARRARRSSWSPRRRRSRAASTPRTQGPGRRRRSTCRRPPRTCVNENGSDCGGDQITLTQALEVSCNVVLRLTRARARRRRAARAGREVRLRPAPTSTTSTGQAISRFPDGPRRAADRAVRDRPVRRRAPRRCRWRWSPPASPTAAR